LLLYAYLLYCITCIMQVLLLFCVCALLVVIFFKYTMKFENIIRIIFFFSSDYYYLVWLSYSVITQIERYGPYAVVYGYFTTHQRT